MVVAQLAERSLSKQTVRGSKPVIGKKIIEHLFTVDCVETTKTKKKSLGMSH